MYSPLKVFFIIGTILFLIGVFPIGRFLYFYMSGDGQGHISPSFWGKLSSLGVITFMIGVIADLINFNRRLLEKVIYRLEKLEDATSSQNVTYKSQRHDTDTGV